MTIAEINYPEVDFDIVAHENRNIRWPHSSYPALTRIGENIIVDMNIIDGMSFALGDRVKNIRYSVININTQIFISDIPAGLYDLILFQNDKVIDIQTKSVRVYRQYPETIKFIQLSDTHLPLFTENFETTEIIDEVFNNITIEKPDFVIITGDFIEGGATFMKNASTDIAPRYTFEQLMTIGLNFIDKWNFPIFVVPGNHDWSIIYPSRKQSIDIWRSYMAPDFVQSFDFGPLSFIGYGAYIDGFNTGEFEEIRDTVKQATYAFKVLYTHYDYNNVIKSNQNILEISLILYGHNHISEIEKIDNALWVKTHNAYEPNKYEPIKGYRVLQMKNPDKLQIGSTNYNFDFDYFVQYSNLINKTSTNDNTNGNSTSSTNIITKITPTTNSKVPNSTTNETIVYSYPITFLIIIVFLRKKGLKYN